MAIERLRHGDYRACKTVAKPHTAAMPLWGAPRRTHRLGERRLRLRPALPGVARGGSEMTTPDGFQVNVEDTAARRRPVTWVYDRQRLGAASGRHGAALFWRRGGFDRQVVMGRSWARPPERSQMTTARTADRGESAAPNPGELIAGVDVVSLRSF